MKAHLILIAGAGLLAAACTTTTMDAPPPSFENVQQLNSADMPAMSLGDFHLAQGLPASMDTQVVIRASTLKPPSKTFSGFLRESLESQLKGAGKLDPAAAVVVSADLTQSKINTDLPNGHATVAAHFRATKAGHVVFDQEVAADDEWPSSFIGAIAIPAGRTHYTALYGKLVTKLLGDPAFRRAINS